MARLKRSVRACRSFDKVRVSVITAGVGGINETDAQLAAASDAILIGFNVRADNAARKVIAEKGLDVQYFSIISAVCR